MLYIGVEDMIELFNLSPKYDLESKKCSGYLTSSSRESKQLADGAECFFFACLYSIKIGIKNCWKRKLS